MLERIGCRTGWDKASTAIRRNLWNRFLSLKLASTCKPSCAMRTSTDNCTARLRTKKHEPLRTQRVTKETEPDGALCYLNASAAALAHCPSWALVAPETPI